MDKHTSNGQQEEESSYGSYDQHCRGVAKDPGGVGSHVEGGIALWFPTL